jgi:hypothetical protein
MDIGFLIDDEENVKVIQGEDRVLKIRLFDMDTKIPVDLTGASISFQAKSKDGGKLALASVALNFVDGNVSVVDNTIEIPSHGLVKNQRVQLTTTGALPTGLAVLTTYYVIVIDENHIALASAKDGTAIDITAAAGGGTHSVDSPLMTITGNDAVLGTVSVPMDDSVTSQLKAGRMQTPEIEYTIGSTTRIVQLLKALDVQEQVV